MHFLAVQFDFSPRYS